MRPAARADAAPCPGLLVLDLGASKALALAVAPEVGALAVRAWAERPSAVTSHGVIVDPESARAVLGAVLDEANTRSGLHLRRVVVGVGGGQVRCVPARGTFRAKLPVVLHDVHLDRALDAAADIGLPADHEVLHVLPNGYVVDGVRVGRSPVGMRGRSVVAEATVVTVRSQLLDHVQRLLERLGYEVVGAAAEPLAAARVALSSEDRVRGAVLLDIGCETTAAAVYRDGAVQALAWVPAGGTHVTRDVAFALQIDFEQAELLKRRAGSALVEATDPSRQVEVLRGRERLTVNQQTLAGIVEARMEELFGMARDALRSQSALGIGDRIVLAGGGARLRGAVELAEQVFESPARIADPAAAYGWREAAGDPACCTALGLVEYAARSGLLHAGAGSALGARPDWFAEGRARTRRPERQDATVAGRRRPCTRDDLDPWRVGWTGGGHEQVHVRARVGEPRSHHRRGGRRSRRQRDQPDDRMADSPGSTSSPSTPTARRCRASTAPTRAPDRAKRHARARLRGQSRRSAGGRSRRTTSSSSRRSRASDMVFVTAGMGGGHGHRRRAARGRDRAASWARSRSASSRSPFDFEGRRRKRAGRRRPRRRSRTTSTRSS